MTGRRRDRIFVYREYLDILNEGTTMPPSGPNVQRYDGGLDVP